MGNIWYWQNRNDIVSIFGSLSSADESETIDVPEGEGQYNVTREPPKLRPTDPSQFRARGETP
jgi:hypothetical protein